MGSDAESRLAATAARLPNYPSPGDAPRTLSLRTLYGLLPGNLQIMVIVIPPLTIAVAIWATLNPRKESLTPALTTAVMIPIYVLMIEWHRRRLNNYLPVVGIVTKVERGEKEFSGCWVIHYAYVISGENFADDHMTSNKRRPEPGELVWLLVHPTKPSKFVLWLEPARAK